MTLRSDRPLYVTRSDGLLGKTPQTHFAGTPKLLACCLEMCIGLSRTPFKTKYLLLDSSYWPKYNRSLDKEMCFHHDFSLTRQIQNYSWPIRKVLRLCAHLYFYDGYRRNTRGHSRCMLSKSASCRHTAQVPSALTDPKRRSRRVVPDLRASSVCNGRRRESAATEKDLSKQLGYLQYTGPAR